MMKLRLGIIAVMAVCILLPGTALSGEKLTLEQMNLIKWMTYYYQHKNHKEFPDKLVAFSKAGLFDFKRRDYCLYGFMSAMFRENPGMVRDCVKAAKKLPERHKRIIVFTILTSKTDVAKELQSKLKQRYDKEKVGNKKNPLDRIPDFDKYPGIYNAGKYMDAQWGMFMATGGKGPIYKIIEVITKYGEYSEFGNNNKVNKKPSTRDEKEDLIKRQIYKTAMWSLKSNAEQHPVVRKYCHDILFNDDLDDATKLSLTLIMINTNPKWPAAKPKEVN
jgi:hypothetical protein